MGTKHIPSIAKIEGICPRCNPKLFCSKHRTSADPEVWGNLRSVLLVEGKCPKGCDSCAKHPNQYLQLGEQCAGCEAETYFDANPGQFCQTHSTPRYCIYTLLENCTMACQREQHYDPNRFPS